MSFTLRQSIRPSLELELSTRITQDQRLAVNIAQLQLQRDLVEAVHGSEFRPKAACPDCGYELKDFEIMKGFNTNPLDFTTECPRCKKRFGARLRCRTRTGAVELAFYCPSQTLNQLEGLTDVPLEEFRTKHETVYHSAIVHFGGLKQAFKKIGLVYAFEADLDWKKLVLPFLGKMADTVIAELLNVAAERVRRLRRTKGILAYSMRAEAESLA